MKRLFCLILLLASAAWRLEAQNPGWPVPDDQKGKICLVKFTPDMVKQGEAIYMKNCQSCHGIPTKKNFAAIVPSPGDLSEPKVGTQKDGELFYRITTGKVPMPEFRNILTEDERWSVIAFLRSFHKGYKQPDPEKLAGAAGKRIKLSMAYDTVKKKIMVKAVELSKDGSQPAKGAEIVVFIQRYFGNMQLTDPKPTSEYGYAGFDWPQDLPGDKKGNVIVTARVNDPTGSMQEALVKDTLTIGVPTDKPSLTDTRAMWSTRDKAPVWIILTYTLAVIVVWYFIIYIILAVLDIRKIKHA
ncbi:MAG: cytochrome c [Bacteroidota bacterium]|jgi:Cytochrome C oxidase, cbb3-type, subunit III